MKLNATPIKMRQSACAAFSLIELLVALSVILIVFVTIFGTLTLSFSITQTSRENLRATQIMLDKLEGVRLYNWSQLNDPNFLKSSFTNWFFETNGIGTIGATGNGVMYTGSVVVSVPEIQATYTNAMRRVTVNIGWQSGNITRTRNISTFVSQNGLQNYYYNN
jgi:prepilin-type N-terminal cleavage/methylation domain-containing protein